MQLLIELIQKVGPFIVWVKTVK